MDPPLYFRRLLLGWAAGTSAIALLAANSWRDSYWGFHVSAFLPPALIALTAVLVLASVAIAARPPFLLRRPPPARFALHPLVLTALLMAATGAILWFARAGHTLLGDGSTIVVDLPRGLQFHPRLALTNYVEHRWYQAVHGWFSGTPADVVEQSVGLGNVLCGVLFTAVAMMLSRTLWGTRHQALAILSTGILLAQGYMQLFAGYVEHYAVYTLAIGVYLLAAVLFLNRRWPLWPAAFALVLTLAAHLSAMVLVPSFAVLMILGFRARRARAVWVGAVALGAGLLGLNALLSGLFHGFNLARGVADLYDTATRDTGRGGGLAYLITPIHLRDFVNGQHLIGPLGGLFLIPALLPLLRRAGARTPTVLFLASTALTVLAASFVTTELRLGYARDWDAFAPPGVIYTAAVLAVMAACIPRNRVLPVLAAAWLFSLAHTVGWVGLNHSPDRSLDRFAHLPLGLGRNDVVLGNRYLRLGDFGQAEACFRRALAANPGNNNAYYLLGVTQVAQDSLTQAAQNLELAVALRPDQLDYRRTAAEIATRLGRLDKASEHLAAICTRAPERTDAWLELSHALRASGHPSAADSALARGVAHFLEASAKAGGDRRWLEGAGRLEVARGRLEPALEHFRAAVQIDPKTETSLIWASSILMQLDRPEDARGYVQSFLSRYPTHAAADGMRSWIQPAGGVDSDSIRR